MPNRDSRDWLQIVGQFGVVASLLFVGLQMKQDREIALSAIYQNRTSTVVEYYMGIATDETARDSLSKFIKGDANLTPSEEDSLRIVFTASKQLLDNSHYQYEHGFLDEEHWYQIRQIIANLLQHPIGRRVLLDGAARPSFLQAVRDIDSELGGTSKE